MFNPLLTKKAIATIGGLLFGLVLFAHAGTAQAAYDGAYLIGNSQFLDAKSMNKQDIQGFLSYKGSGLADRSFVLNCYGPSSKERQWYTAAGAPCDQSVPASHIIYYAAQIYGVSPKVVLATLQKEQSLITSPNPTSWQINQAMGYGCPTTGGCDASNFFYQIDSGVWVLRWHYERARGNNTWWRVESGWTCGSEKDFYKPNLYPGQNVRFYDEDGVLYRTYFIANAATSSLYCYTPHAYNNPQGLYGREPFGSVGRYYSGSYNFVYYYELWFGSTRYKYAAEMIENKLYTDAARTDEVTTGESIRSGVTLYATITAKNSGSRDWSNSFVKIGTRSPHNHPSVFANDSWMSAARPVRLQEASVKPGEVGTFEFTITTPNVDGEYIGQFQIVAEQIAWMKYRSRFDIPIEVRNPYNAQITYKRAYSDSSYTTRIGNTLPVGEKIYWRILARNTGTSTWDNSIVKIGTAAPLNRTSDLEDSNWPSPTRPALLKESSVAPGEIGTFEYATLGPTSGGIYKEAFGIVAEGVSWMPNAVHADDIKVTNTPDRLLSGQRLVAGSELRTGSYKLIMQGDGNLVLYNGTGRAVWNSGTRNSNRLIMQGDGNLVLYNGGTPLWSSRTTSGTRLIMQGDGNLVLYNGGTPLWSSRTKGM